MKSTTLRLAGAAFVVALVAALAATSVVASPKQSSKSLVGGTYRVGWESSFGWTDSFDKLERLIAQG